MGFSSYITLYRKHKKFRLGEEDIKKLSELYYNYNKKNSYISSFSEISDEEKNKRWSKLPIVIDRAIEIEGNDYDKNNIVDVRNRFFIDWQPTDRVIEDDFCSSFKAIYDEFGMGSSEENNSIRISHNDAEDMIKAIKYLLSGKYDVEFERILNNKWVKIFGEHYNRYMIARYPEMYMKAIASEDNDEDKSGYGMWTMKTINSAPSLSPSEDEEDLGWEGDYRRFLTILEVFNADYWLDRDDYEYVLVYSGSY